MTVSGRSHKNRPDDRPRAWCNGVQAFRLGVQHVYEALCKPVGQTVSNRGLLVRLVGLVLAADLPAGQG